MRLDAKRWLGGLLAAALVSACHFEAALDTDEDSASSSETSGSETTGETSDTGEEPPTECIPPAAATSLVRLTHLQYDRTVADLFPGLELPEPPSAGFLPDPSFGGFNNNVEGLRVPARLARDYRRAGESLAQAVVSQPHVWATIVPCSAAQASDPEVAHTCLGEMIETLGLRAYRRPLTPTEVQAYRDIHTRGDGLYETGDGFTQGVQLVLEAMLQSPGFLYRVELSAGPLLPDAEGEATVRSNYELASRLSYFLWNSMPDAELFAAAEASLLQTREGIEAQARRMLDDPRANETLDDFHGQWLQVRDYAGLTRDPQLFPGFTSDVASSLRGETLRFVEHVIQEQQGSYSDLLTAPVTVVNPTLAAYYGFSEPLPGSETHTDDDTWTVVEQDPGVRAGLLTQTGFLTAHADPTRSSPIRRGVFVHRNLLCTQLPDPPQDADFDLPEPSEGDPKTTREIVEAHTAAPACSDCHNLINPAGFAFEHFDAVGRFRSDEHGLAIDASGSIPIAGGTLTFSDHLDLVHQLAELDQARRCYLTQWFRYASGRLETPADSCTLDSLMEEWGAVDHNIRELLVTLATSKTFRYQAN
ncbi:MAG: DUF1592 domain-containing protein [Nannocystaceae bacterium]